MGVIPRQTRAHNVTPSAHPGANSWVHLQPTPATQRRCLVSRLRCFCAVVRYETRRPTPCCSGLAHGRKAMRHSPGPGNRRRAPGACAYVNSSCTGRGTKRSPGNRNHGAGRSADSANWRRTSASHWQDWMRYEARFPRHCALVALQRALRSWREAHLEPYLALVGGAREAMNLTCCGAQ